MAAAVLIALGGVGGASADVATNGSQAEVQARHVSGADHSGSQRTGTPAAHCDGTGFDPKMRMNCECMVG